MALIKFKIKILIKQIFTVLEYVQARLLLKEYDKCCSHTFKQVENISIWQCYMYVVFSCEKIVSFKASALSEIHFLFKLILYFSSIIWFIGVIQ